MYLFLLLLPLGFSSCEQPRLHYAELEAYYAESQQLSASPRDSNVRFSRKVQGFVTRNPDATEDPLYPKIKSNISLSLRLTDSSWGEDRTITFGGDRQPKIVGAKCVGCPLFLLVCPTGAIGTARRIPKRT